MTRAQPTSLPADDKWVSYKHPQPKDSPPELVIPNAIPSDERIWVPVDENVWFRPLLLAASRGYWMNLLRVRKSGVLSRHRHPQPVHGFVLRGEWRYLEHDWIATALAQLGLASHPPRRIYQDDPDLDRPHRLAK